MTTRRSVLAVLLMACLAASVRAEPAGPATKPAPPAGEKAVVVSLSGEVNDYTRDALVRNFAVARQRGATVVIVRIDTYGGLVTSGLDISRFLKNQHDLHTVAFVDSKAISAGAMIALACDEIVMTPSASLGDCAPIRVSSVGGMENVGATERSKMESPVLSDFAESARRNGHDPLLAAAMVSLPYTVHWVEAADGSRRFVDAADYKTLTASGDWKPVAGEKDPIDSPDTLLTVSTPEAVRFGLARGTAATAEALAAERGYPVVADLSPSAADVIVAVLGGPWVRGLLLVVFLQSLFIALQTPGHGAAEAVCLVALGLLVGVPLLTGYAQWWEIAMIFVGLGLVAFEIFVFPGHLVSLVVGGVMVLAGLLLTFIGNVWTVPGSWQMPGTLAGLEKGVQVMAAGLVCSFLLSMWLRRYLPQLPYFNRLILTATTGGDAATTLPPRVVGPADLAEDVWPFVGTIGVATSELKPGGLAKFPYGDDTRVAAVVNEAGFVPAGAKLLVREVRGNRIVVRAIS